MDHSENRDSLVPRATETVVTAMNRWSGALTRLLLPSDLGTKATITQTADEGAKVLSMGMYAGNRTAEVTAIPYDGSTYEGHTIRDESTGTLWAYETALPSGFEARDGEGFLISLGHIFKCSECKGQGKVRCSTCGGKIQWREKNWKDEIVEKTCSCGDGKMNCHQCSGYGQMLKALQVRTRYSFDEKKTKEYSGRLPEQLLMGSSGDVIFEHAPEFDKRAVAEAIDGFDAAEFDRLMRDTHAELHAEVANRVSSQLVNAKVLEELIDGYFAALANPIATNKRLREEVLPVRMKCEVRDVPVTAVTYTYKDKPYSLYVYGKDGTVWVNGDQPSDFTWKLGIVIGLVVAVIVLFAFAL